MSAASEHGPLLDASSVSEDDTRGGSDMDANRLLEIRDLRISFDLDEGLLKAVDGVSLHIERGETLGLVGESGCGKSVIAQSILNIVPDPGRVEGSILFNRSENGKRGTSRQVDITSLNPSGNAMRSIRGKDITMIFQEPMTSLSPVHSIGNQIMEAILLHRTQDKSEAREIAVDMLARVGIANPGQRIDEYPHQLSGGMRQRAMIAMALSCNPALLIADEPTTALDVTVQAQVLELMLELRGEFKMAILFITHDLGVIAEIAHRVAVMYLGRIVETAGVKEIFHNPCHPYTRALLSSIPKMGGSRNQRLASIPGSVPIPINLEAACAFRERCREYSGDTCLPEIPPLVEVREGHWVRCHRYRDIRMPE